MLYICLMTVTATAAPFAVQQERFLSETGTAVFLYVLQDGDVYAMNSFPHLHRLGFLLNAEEIQTFHLHEFTEVLLLVKGHLLHEVNGSHHILAPGTLVFVRPYDLHRLLPVNSERTLFASLVLDSSVMRELMAYLNSPAVSHRFNTVPEAPYFRLEPEKARELMLQMEGISNEQAVAPEVCTVHARVLAAQLFAAYFLPGGASDGGELTLPPHWLSALREEAESWDSLRGALARLQAGCTCHPSHLCKSFQRHYGETPTAFINRLRLRRAVRLLDAPGAKVAAVAAELGFDSLSHFHRMFRLQYGLTPASYRRARSTPPASDGAAFA